MSISKELLFLHDPSILWITLQQMKSKRLIYLHVLAWKDLQDLLLHEKSKLQNRAYDMNPFL